MWIRMLDSGQEIDLADLSKARTFVAQGHAVEIPEPKPRALDNRTQSSERAAIDLVGDPAWRQATVLAYNVGLPKAVIPLIRRILVLEAAVAELKAAPGFAALFRDNIRLEGRIAQLEKEKGGRGK